MNNIQFIKDHLKYLDDQQIKRISKIVEEVSHPMPWRTSIEIDTDMDFVVVDDEGNRHGWEYNEVKYFETEQECIDWLNKLANNFHWDYEQKKHTAWMVRDWIFEIIENRDFMRSMGGNQTVNLSIEKVF